jgi:hypothetical protein
MWSSSRVFVSICYLPPGCLDTRVPPGPLRLLLNWRGERACRPGGGESDRGIIAIPGRQRAKSATHTPYRTMQTKATHSESDRVTKCGERSKSWGKPRLHAVSSWRRPGCWNGRRASPLLEKPAAGWGALPQSPASCTRSRKIEKKWKLCWFQVNLVRGNWAGCCHVYAQGGWGRDHAPWAMIIMRGVKMLIVAVSKTISRFTLG